MDSSNSSSEVPTDNGNENNEPSTSAEEILPGFDTFDDFRQAAFKSLMEATRNSSNLPMESNWDYYSTFPSFKKIMDEEGSRILRLISMVLRHQGMKGNILKRDLEDKFELIIDANDTLLERVGCNLDEMAGLRRKPEPILMEAMGSCTRPVSGSWNKKRTESEPQRISHPPPVRLLTAKNIQRPQIRFKDKIDNSSAPFEPKIKEKPNSLKPLALHLEVDNEGDECFSHPYEYELDLFKPSPAQLEPVTPHMYKPVEETPLVYVDSEDQLPGLLEDLAKYSEIAVDLEHHSYRSFLGITCLMQISTRDTDYIIDTLELRDKLHCLNEIFTKRSIVKVFHGADSDIEWLQRDLGLYVVNMFDTHLAAKTLQFAQLSLAFLLKHYCKVMANKHFQLADWRIRPLPEELILYAREDTHYLLYIYDMLRNNLLDAANGQNYLLQSVYQLSTDVCRKCYNKPLLKEDSHMRLYLRNKKLFDNRQLYALKELYRWRDKIARQDDESTGYVLPNHMMLQIAETLPREMQGILACCNPIPPLVRQNLLPLHYIVLQAREQPLVKPILEDKSEVRLTTQSWLKVNLDGALHCPHDLSQNQDFRDDLPTVMAGTLKPCKEEMDAVEKLSGKSIVSLFESEEEKSDDEDHLKHIKFVCPFERYKRVKPFVQSKEAEAQKAQVNGSQPDDNTERIQRIKDHFVEVNCKLEQQKKSAEEKMSEEPAAQPEVKEPRNQNQKAKKRKRGNKKNKSKAKDGEDDEGELHTTKRMKVESEELNINVPKKKKPKQIGEGFQPFNFNQFNYNQFQGGSKTPQANNSVKMMFKNKGKKKGGRGKKRNKGMSFTKGW